MGCAVPRAQKKDTLEVRLTEAGCGVTTFTADGHKPDRAQKGDLCSRAEVTRPTREAMAACDEGQNNFVASGSNTALVWCSFINNKNLLLPWCFLSVRMRGWGSGKFKSMCSLVDVMIGGGEGTELGTS